ncbi:MAG TPA: c-type cytochrome domain-containing protein [Actinomycetota bacterium]
MRPRPYTPGGRRILVPVVGALLALSLVPTAALAHGSMDEQPPEAQVTEPGAETGGGMSGTSASARSMATHLEVIVPKEATLGRPVLARAVLTDRRGGPIAGMTIVFEADAFWGEEFQGHMVIGSAVTNRDGVATLTTRPRTSGGYEIAAYFPGSGRYEPVMEEVDLEVHGDTQLYSPSAGIRIPGLNLWVLAAVIAFVWAMFFLVGVRILRISRPPSSHPATRAAVTGQSRRQFLARALPLGAQVGIAAIGTGLVAVVARSPRTHGNLMAPPATAGYHRTSVAHLGQAMEMREMPEPLTRPVSFSNEVLPIFLANGGPHVVAPEDSPPPGGLRLDSYEGVMANEAVIVPGKPEKSELIEHLLSVGMQMPPSLPPLAEEQIQLIVTWIAQGASDN